MAEHQDVLLKIWREACQHIEIQESATGIAALLGDHVPVGRLQVFRVEPAHNLAACVADTAARGRDGANHQADLSTTALKKLAAWIAAGEVAAPDERGRLVPPLAPLELEGDRADLRAAPLQHGLDTRGVLVIHASNADRFTAQHDDIVRALIEPFSAALANDRRLHELAALREAAEADRRSLLRRLGRTNLADRIVGDTGGLAQVMKRVELVSQSDAPVLLLGETGTGKEVIARAIHDRSNRREGPFIRVNCGAIPSELVDSQLFGHEKGAFTGAAEMRRGWFERADGGTLFLDEIGELPPDAQVRFLRVLQDSFIERVGGGELLRVDVRVIAATHRDLAAMAQEGRFREDLWYRIAVFPILLPPLRDRLGDIAVLAEHFAERAANRFGLPYAAPSPADIELLCRYHWPGNIRELGAVVDRAAILGEGQALHIDAALGLSAPMKPAAGRTPPDAAGNEHELAPLDHVIRAHIERTLATTKGRIEGPQGAALLLGVNPHTLRAKMRKLGVAWSKFRAH